RTNAPRRHASRPRQSIHDLLLLPHFLDAHLLRLPPANDRQRPPPHAPQRRHHDSQLHQLQFPGPPRRYIYVGHRRHGHQSPHRARAFLLRRPRLLPKRQSRMALLHAANHLRSRLLRPGLQHFRPAHGARPRNQAMLRLPHLRGQRQQRLDGPTPPPGHQFHEFHGTLRLRSHREKRLPSHRRRRTRRARSHLRQRPPPHRLPRQLQKIPRARTRTRNGSRARWQRPRYPGPRRIRLRRHRIRRHPRLRHRQHRQQRLLRAHHQRPSLPHRPKIFRSDKKRSSRRLALNSRRRPSPHPAPRKRRATHPSPLRLPLRGRQGRRPRHHRRPKSEIEKPRRRHPPRRQPRQQFPQARRHLQSRRRANRSP